MQLKEAALGQGSGRFDQLVSLVDQGQAKLSKLVRETKKSNDTIRNLVDSLEGQVAPHSQTWIQETAKTGELPQELLDRVEKHNSSRFGTNERDALNRKMAKLTRMKNDRLKKTDLEAGLMKELEQLSGIPRYEWIRPDEDGEGGMMVLPPRSEEIMEHVANGAEKNIQKLASLRELMPRGDQGRSTDGGKGGPGSPNSPGSAKARALKKLDQIAAGLRKVEGMREDVVSVLPQGASIEGDLMLNNFGSFCEESRSVERITRRVDCVEDIRIVETAVLDWSHNCSKIIQGLDFASDTLSFDVVPEKIKEVALEEEGPRITQRRWQEAEY